MLTTVKLTRANAQGSFVIKICKCAGLMSESLALVDLLVLAHARHFAGLTGSSFSWVVRVRHCVGSRSMSTALETLPFAFRSQVGPLHDKRCCHITRSLAVGY